LEFQLLVRGDSATVADQIQVQYEQVKTVSSSFTNQAQVVQDMLQHVQSSYNALQWKGEAYTKFEGEMQQLVFPASQRLIHALEEAAKTADKVSSTVSDAESNASSLFKV
jgi:WXG100 family type VII secretion target